MSQLPHTSGTAARKPRRLSIAAVALLALLTPVVSSVPAHAETAPGGAGDLQSLTRKAVDAGYTGLVIRQDDGRHVVRATAGAARLEPRRDARPGDATRIGSITKTFVSTVVLQLEAERRVRLDEPVDRYLPGLVPGGDRITVRMLLNHTSGLFNYTEDPTVQETIFGADDRDWTPQQILEVVRSHEPVFAPGTSWSYSNTNYIVAGLLIEKITGHRADSEITRRIIRPLGLRSTYLAATPDWRGPHLDGYVRADGTVLDTASWPIGWAWTAGAMVSTTDDLDTFLSALLGGRLLPPAQLAEMKTAAPAGEVYGLGLYHSDTPCGRVWGHDGALPGYATLAFTDETGRRSVVAFLPTNPAPPESVAPLRTALLTAICGMFGKPVPPDAGEQARALTGRPLPLPLPLTLTPELTRP